MNTKIIDLISDPRNYYVSKIFIWANSDLDGAASTVLLKNVFKNTDYKSVFFGNFLEEYLKWEENIDNYDMVFVVGMVLDQGLVNKIDDARLTFISDKSENLKVYDSTLICEDTTSCCKLLYNKFNKLYDFPVDVIKLVGYVNDYNCGAGKFEESEYINALFRNRKYDKFGWFVDRFFHGYDGFTDNELKLAESFFEKIDEEFSKMEIYEGQFKGWSVICSTIGPIPVNEIAKKLLDNYKHDVIILVNTDTKFVSFRKRAGSDADIIFMAENMCDGGGTEYASGGTLTKKFLEFSTSLNRI